MCDTVTEYLDRIKSQFTGTSKTYATQLIKQLVTESHSENSAIRELMMLRQNYSTVILGHIWRGRIERLVKNDILPPLELSD